MIRVQEDLRTIEITRGDSAGANGLNGLAFRLPCYNGTETTDYEFQLDDKITFVAFKKKSYTKEEVIRKEYTLREIGYTEPTTIVEIPLSTLETLKFPAANKPITYWYEIRLNDNLTLLGHDADGASKIIVYPISEKLT